MPRYIPLLIVTILILVITITIPTHAQQSVSGNADIRVDLLNQEPDPAKPGQLVDLRFRISNEGGVDADDLTLTFKDQYPFSLYDDDERTRDVGDMTAYQVRKDSVVVEYTVRVDPRAVEGQNDVRVRYDFNVDGREYSIEREFDVRVRTEFPNIAIQSVTVDPPRMAPGSEGTISVQVANTAPTQLNDVRVALGITGEDVPFVPIGSGAEKQLGVLLEDGSATFDFRVMTEPSAASGVYKVPVDITFADAQFNQSSRTDTIGVIVGEQPDLTVEIDDLEIAQGFTRGTIPLRIINRGATEAFFATLSIDETDAYTIVGSTQEYIGNLNSDDFETMDVVVLNEDTSAQRLMMPVTLTYEDANYVEYTIDTTLEIPLLDEKALGQSETPWTTIIIVLSVIAIIAFVVVRRMRRRSSS